MCGILGVAGPLRAALAEPAFMDALDLIRHRGPDGGALWSDDEIMLGHRRLAIVDLAARADQPMLLGDLALVFNGEIYNFRALRDQLIAAGHSFSTSSDSEVLLRSWLQWGRDCLQRFEGMYAFALWNRRSGKLFLARDRFGEKPLFVYRGGDGFAFASELPPLIRLRRGELEEDRAALGLYFRYSYIPAPQSAFLQIGQLEPGCWLEWSATEGIREGRYYELRAAVAEAARLEQPDYATAVIDLRNRLTASVRLRVESSDVPVASLLSGGIDSSVASTLAAQLSPDGLAVYSLGFPQDPGFDETEYARAVVAMLPGARHRVVEATEDLVLASASDMLDRLGEPFADASILPTALLCSHIDEKVVLSGDGADELFAGYGVYPAIMRGKALGRFGRALLRLLPVQRNPSLIAQPSLRALAFFRQHLRDDPLDAYLSWRSYADPARLTALGIDCSAHAGFRSRLGQSYSGSLQDLQITDMVCNLPNDMLKKVDYAAMVHGLEVRLPFLDSQLAQWALALPDSYRLQGRVRKRVLRDAFADVLPEKVMKRGKMGFLLPIRQWFRNGRLGTELHYMLKTQRQFDRSQAQALLQEHVNGTADHSVLLWSLYVYLRWKVRLESWSRHVAPARELDQVQRLTDAARLP